MMKDYSNVKRAVILTLSGIVFCSPLTLSDSIKVSAKGNQEYGYCVSNGNCGDINSILKIGVNTDTAYDVVFSDTLKMKEKNIPLKILLNPQLCTDGVIQIDNQENPINRELAETIGYAHVQAMAYDFTGDGNEEIALLISGGASGSMQAVQVFGNIDGKWNEINIPSDIYSDIPEFLKEQQKKLDMKMDASLVHYRTISFDEEKILITYHLITDSDTKTNVEVCKTLLYSSNQKEFVLGDTLVKPITPKCKITTTANKRAITIKWDTAEKKSSIKGAQIKVSTGKNMKSAKVYKLGKKKAKKMSYQFTVKSGKIAKNKTYYFKVRLKTGKQWTKWSSVKKAEIKKQ